MAQLLYKLDEFHLFVAQINPIQIGVFQDHAQLKINLHLLTQFYESLFDDILFEKTQYELKILDEKYELVK